MTSDAKTADAPRCDLLTTGDMARKSQSTLRTVRFYQEAGLVEPTRRSAGGHRLFDHHQLHKLQLALGLREAGLSVQDIKTLYDLKDSFECPEAASSQMSTLLNEKIQCMQDKIASLKRLRSELTAMVAVISDCRQCEHEAFPASCEKCEVFDNPDLPRALKVLWRS